MNRQPLAVLTSDTVDKALDLLLKNHLLALPIVDGDGRYQGMFLKSKLISRLLPVGANVGETVHHISQMPDLAFLTLSVADLRKAFGAIASQPVKNLADVKTPVFRPDSPISSALLQLYRTRNFVPVVEEGTERLVGMISTWDLLGRLTPDRQAPQQVGGVPASPDGLS